MYERCARNFLAEGPTTLADREPHGPFQRGTIEDMPTPTTAELPKPKSWDEFEDIVLDVLKKRWNTPSVTRNGRNGQGQHGVDIYGQPKYLDIGEFAGVQTKRVKVLDLKTVKDEIANSEGFKPTLAEFLFVTTANRDAKLQESVRHICQQRQKAGKFPVEVLFWEDTCLELTSHPELVAKHFPGWGGLDVPSDAPEFRVALVVDGVEEQPLSLQRPPDSLIDYKEHIKPKFRSSDLEWLKSEHPDDWALAKQYNRDVDAALANTTFEEEWLRHTLPKRRNRYGVLVGVRVGVEQTIAHDVRVTLDVPTGLEVFEGDEVVDEADRPNLPHKPQLDCMSVRGSSMLGLTRIHLPQPVAYRPTIIRTPRIAKLIGSVCCEVVGQIVTIEIGRILPRRPVDFTDKDEALVLVPRGEMGVFHIKWTADASNLPGPVHGELEVEVVEPSEPELDRKALEALKAKIGDNGGDNDSD